MTFTVIDSLKQIGEKLLKKNKKTTHQAHLSLHKKQTALYRTLHNHCKVSSEILLLNRPRNKSSNHSKLKKPLSKWAKK